MKVIIRLRPLKRRHRRSRRTTVLVVASLVLAGGAYYVVSSVLEATAPDRAEVQYQLGMSLAKPGTYPQAIARFGDAIRIRQDFAEAYLQRGIVHHVLGENGPALADLDRAVTLNPDLSEAYNVRGVILRDQGDFKSAIEALTECIRIQPTADAYYQRGQTYESNGQHQKAIDDYDRAVDLLSTSPFIYRARALAKRNLGDLEGAKADQDNAVFRGYSGR